MQRPATILLMMTASVLALTAGHAQSAPAKDNFSIQTPAPSRSARNWNSVRELSHGEEINVFASRNRHVRCLFTGATDDYLFCEPRFPREGQGEYRFDRADVDKVRLEQGERNFKATIGISAAVGAITLAAATNTSKNNGGERVIAGLAGALAGGFAGILIAGPVALLTPGHLIYERPRAQRSAHAFARSKKAEVSQAQQEAQ